ncbi:hypothetical protein, partial [Sphingobacterium corticibacterium]|uniref:hypothetical protein n=1 Tax=Sphingobacterium corticibacterium TaxID=2484746 RepID=UPI0019D18DA0
ARTEKIVISYSSRPSKGLLLRYMIIYLKELLSPPLRALAFISIQLNAVWILSFFNPFRVGKGKEVSRKQKIFFPKFPPRVTGLPGLPRGVVQR